MLRLIINTLLTIVLAFSGASVGVLLIDDWLIPPQPDAWGGVGVLLALSIICGVVAAIVGGIATFSIGSQSIRQIDRWDLLGWLIGLVSGLAFFPLLPNRYHFPVRCLIAASIIPTLMFVGAFLSRWLLENKLQKAADTIR